MHKCYSCGSNKTYIDRNNAPHWYYNHDIDSNMLCENCNNKYVKNPKWHNITHPLTNSRLMWFTPSNKLISLNYSSRIGVCNWCRAVKGFDCKRTSLHHDEDNYDLNNPLKNTIEICIRCHMKWSRLKTK